MSIDTTDLTPAQQQAEEEAAALGFTPSQEDWDWYFGEFYVDPAERA